MHSDLERWNKKVDRSKGCWLWTGATYRFGYGHFRRKINNKWVMEKAHRFSYEYFNGVSRESMIGLVVMHKCDTPSCVNPEHLSLGTVLDNNNDKLKKGRHSFGRNKTHSCLSLEIAEQIRETKKQNFKLTYRELGLQFNVSSQQVHRIVTNQIWKRK